MELRNRGDGTTHFIRTIKRGREIIAQNTNSKGRPVIKFKTLKDVYENEGANGLRRGSSGLVFGHEQVKHEDTCFPQVDRTLWGTDTKSDDELSPAEHNLDTGLDDDITLKQLKKRIFMKKRKHIPKQEEKKAVLEESDLHEPLINLKPKRSKTSKSKRRRVNLSIVSSSAVDFAISYDENSVSEVSPQVICVKVEVPDEGLNPGETSTNGFQNMTLCDCRGQVICAQEYQNCSNGAGNIFYDYVEDVEPIFTIVPWHGTSDDLEHMEIECEEFLDFSPLYIQTDNEISDAHCYGLSTTEDISSSGQELWLVPNELQESPSSPDKDCGYYPEPINYSVIEQNVVSTEDTLADEEQPLTYSFNVIRMNGLNCEGYSEGELLKAEEKQTKALAITDGVSQSSLENRTCDIADTISTPILCLPHENLLLTRKEQCLVMNSVDIWNDAGQNVVPECKENLFGEQTTKKASSLRSEIQHDKATVNHRRPDKVREQKIIIKPRQNIKKSQNPKGNLEGRRFSRGLHKLSTECTSIQSCSERAIEFSKQQMHNMESLALKLMDELKSMKDIMEQKLLFEAYRNVSLKNDADEVKSAIKSASKVEITSRKWLSIMSRDCNRFCKIMNMTPNTTAASKDTTPPRERKKLVFADEAGGNLCHVKFF